MDTARYVIVIAERGVNNVLLNKIDINKGLLLRLVPLLQRRVVREALRREDALETLRLDRVYSARLYWRAKRNNPVSSTPFKIGEDGKAIIIDH